MRIKVVKKDGVSESFNFEKIAIAVAKSADRVGKKLTKDDLNKLHDLIKVILTSEKRNEIEVYKLHTIVQTSLVSIDDDIANSYSSYRNYKIDNARMFQEISRDSEIIMYDVDRENANSNSALISTKKSLMAGRVIKSLYIEYLLNNDQKNAIKDGYIYIHDLMDRFLGSINCCLFDLANVMKGGFDMNNLKYTEPSTILSACSVAGDVIMASSAQQYGGHTTPEIDTTLAYYCEKTYKHHIKEYENMFNSLELKVDQDKIEKLAKDKTYEDLLQGIQSMEVKLNTVVSARGSFPFTTFTFGADKSYWATMVSKAILSVRKRGQGQDRKIQIFPKLVFLYEYDLHGKGKELEWLFEESIECSKKAMYPDYLSPKFHKREGKWVSPMGCRAYLSNYRDEKGDLQFIGRGNIGAVSLNLPMIFMRAKEEQRDFFEILDYYLKMIRQIHIKTYQHISKMRASSNPLGYMQGGFYGGNLGANDQIRPIIRTFTASFGVTALNELQQLANHHSILVDKEFAMKTMKYIDKRINEFKESDGYLYAIYGTPAESLCGTQLEQFRELYGEIKNVSDRNYFTNSFHCHVSEEIDPFTKQDNELELFKRFMGGHIQYTRISDPDNTEALINIIRRGMDLGFYSGVNFDACQCEICNEKGIDFKGACPKCGSENYTEFNRTCGYLGYSKIQGNTTFNDAKMAEIRDRKSM
ncbi:MAG: anaerobic ribonucleoside-triphosphate reductase [Mycoplasma sp.]